MENSAPSNTPAPVGTLSPQDERILAALAHVGILLPMMGLLAPILIWVTQREKSRYVAFQSLQAVAFHLSMVIIWVLGFACYFLSFFVMFGGTALAGFSSSNGSEISPLLGGLFIAPFIVFFGILLSMLVMFVYGIVAAVMTFQGKDFRYALIGRWVERYQQRA